MRALREQRHLAAIVMQVLQTPASSEARLGKHPGKLLTKQAFAAPALQKQQDAAAH
jgi:hypothetical protein